MAVYGFFGKTRLSTQRSNGNDNIMCEACTWQYLGCRLHRWAPHLSEFSNITQTTCVCGISKSWKNRNFSKQFQLTQISEFTPLLQMMPLRPDSFVQEISLRISNRYLTPWWINHLFIFYLSPFSWLDWLIDDWYIRLFKNAQGKTLVLTESKKIK